MMADVETPTIEDALLAMSAVDRDGARQLNGVGYNKRDSAFGRSLAFQLTNGRTLSAKQLAAAYRMLRTYQVQLRSYGIEYDAIPEPSKPAPETAVVPTLVYCDGTIVVTFNGYPGPLLPFVKDVPGQRYVPETKDWIVPVDRSTLPYLEAWPTELPLPAEVRELIARWHTDQAVTEVASRATDADIEGELYADLFPFQRAGVAYAVEHRKVIIGDEMGLGKTVQALATCEHEGAFPALIVVPAVVKLNWRREAKRWLPHREVTVLQGRTPSVQALHGAEFVVVNYDILSAWRETLQKIAWRAVIFDESHYLKNPKAARTKAAKAVAGQADIRLMLSGTPILNRPVELTSQLEVLGRLREFGGFWTFVKRYCDAHQGSFGWDMNGASNLTELNRKLRATCMVRRTKEQVLTELPAKRRAIVPIELTDRSEYERVQRELAVWLKQRILADEAFITEMRTMGADADFEAAEQAHERERRMGRAKVLVMTEALRDTAARQKLDGAIKWIEDFLESGKKLVVFAHHRDVADAIWTHFVNSSVRLTGETTPALRQKVVDRFQNEEGIRLFVGNIQAAGVGITLTAASDVAFVELPWRPGDLTQAEDRCHRIGQTDSVTAWYLLADGTIEEKIASMLDAKRQVVDETTDGKVGLAEGESIIEALMDALEDEVS